MVLFGVIHPSLRLKSPALAISAGRLAPSRRLTRQQSQKGTDNGQGDDPGNGVDLGLFGAQLAAELGLPYRFASHFAPQAVDTALKIYRERFKPSEQLSAPYALVGINVVAADTDQEARRLATSQQMSFAGIFSGARDLMQPPIGDTERYWSPHEKAQASQMLACKCLKLGAQRAGRYTAVERRLSAAANVHVLVTNGLKWVGSRHRITQPANGAYSRFGSQHRTF